MVSNSPDTQKMIEIECHEVSYGWESVSSPDTMELELRIGRASLDFSPSVVDLIRTYIRTDRGVDGEICVGASDIFRIERDPESDLAEIQLSYIVAQVDQNELQSALAGSIGEIFKKKDSIDGDQAKQKREEAFEIIDSSIEVTDQEIANSDTKSLYSHLL